MRVLTILNTRVEKHKSLVSICAQYADRLVAFWRNVECRNVTAVRHLVVDAV